MPRLRAAALLLLAAGLAVAQGPLAVALSARVVSIEPGEAYLVRYDLDHPCGAARRIDLTVEWPPWIDDAAVEDVRVAEGRCTRQSGDIVVEVGRFAAAGAEGELRLLARDGDAFADAVLALRVRRTDPAVEVRSFGEAVLGAHAGGEMAIPIAATYTLPEAGTLRWSAQAPDGWRVGLPAVRSVPGGEDASIEGSLALTPPRTGGGPADVTLVATVAAPDGRVAESAPATLHLEVTPVAPDEVLDPLEDEARAAREGERVPPRAPLWLAGAVFVAMVAGVYALETREARRGGKGGAP